MNNMGTGQRYQSDQRPTVFAIGFLLCFILLREHREELSQEQISKPVKKPPPFLDFETPIVPENGAERSESHETDVTDTEATGHTKDQTFVIDVISIGSSDSTELHRAQKATLGTHPAVRTFLPVTEHDDTDRLCHAELTAQDVTSIRKFCHTRYPNQSETSALVRLKNFQPSSLAPSELCAQKRLIDGLRLLLDRYKQDTIPDYLMLIADDTYINMQSTISFLSSHHPPDIPTALGGCRVANPKKLFFTLPQEGFGAILTKQAIGRFTTPLQCDDSEKDRFIQFACWRLTHNTLGEREFFQPGMSVADIMFAFSDGLPFTNHPHWTNGVGYCYNDDVLLAYFIGYYFVAVRDEVLQQRALNDNVRVNHPGFVNFGHSRKYHQCEFSGSACSAEAKICKGVTVEQMLTLSKKE